MTNDTMGTLRVLKSQGGQETLLFSQTGDQGNKWYTFKKEFPVDEKVTYNVSVQNINSNVCKIFDFQLEDSLPHFFYLHKRQDKRPYFKMYLFTRTS